MQIENIWDTWHQLFSNILTSTVIFQSDMIRTYPVFMYKIVEVVALISS